MRTSKIGVYPIAELTLGHCSLLSDDITEVLGVFAQREGADTAGFEARSLRIMAASVAIAAEESTGDKPPRTASGLDSIADNLRWGMSRGDLIAGLAFVLDLKPSASSGTSVEKKQTGSE